MTCDVCKYYSEKVQEACPFCSDKVVSRVPINTTEPGTPIPVAEGSILLGNQALSINPLYDDLTFIEVESPVDFKTRIPLPEVEYIDPEVYSAVGFRVVRNPGNIHCITANSPELAQRVAELLNQDGWNAKKAKLQTTTPSGAGSD